jgi:hypothetical protein
LAKGIGYGAPYYVILLAILIERVVKKDVKYGLSNTEMAVAKKFKRYFVGHDLHG